MMNDRMGAQDNIITGIKQKDRQYNLYFFRKSRTMHPKEGKEQLSNYGTE